MRFLKNTTFLAFFIISGCAHPPTTRPLAQSEYSGTQEAFDTASAQLLGQENEIDEADNYTSNTDSKIKNYLLDCDFSNTKLTGSIFYRESKLELRIKDHTEESHGFGQIESTTAPWREYFSDSAPVFLNDIGIKCESQHSYANLMRDYAKITPTELEPIVTQGKNQQHVYSAYLIVRTDLSAFKKIAPCKSCN